MLRDVGLAGSILKEHGVLMLRSRKVLVLYVDTLAGFICAVRWLAALVAKPSGLNVWKRGRLQCLIDVLQPLASILEFGGFITVTSSSVDAAELVG
eukprot:scaffold31724_cov30-Prasinocladus_malaysianus.AAC.2